MLLWPACARAESVQNAVARQLTGTPRSTSTDMLRGELGWMSVEAQRHVQVLGYLHRLHRMDAAPHEAGVC